MFAPPPEAYIRDVTLSIEPSAEALVGAAVTLHCQVELSQPVATYMATMFDPDYQVIYTQMLNRSEEAQCLLRYLILVHNGKYACIAQVGEEVKSDAKMLTVRGVFANMDTVLPVGD